MEKTEGFYIHFDQCCAWPKVASCKEYSFPIYEGLVLGDDFTNFRNLRVYRVFTNASLQCWFSFKGVGAVI